MAGTENPHKNDLQRQEPIWGALLATRATKKEYSGELGFQNDSKREPKMDPKVIQKREPAQKHEKVNLDHYLLHLSHVDRLQKGSFFYYVL